MTLPFQPGYTSEIVDAAPDGAVLADAPRMVAALLRLGFRPVGVVVGRGVGASVPLRRRIDDDELQAKWHQGEAVTLYLSADGRTLADPTSLFGCDLLRFRSLRPDGTVICTRRGLERHPDLAVPAEADAVPQRVWSWLSRLEGRTEDSVFPDLPYAGVRIANRALAPDALWDAHRRHLAPGEAVALDERALQAALLYRWQHALQVHKELVQAAYTPFSRATWLAVGVPPVLLLAWLGPTCVAAALAVAWVVPMLWIGRDLLVLVSTRRVLTPLLRRWPWPARVPASRMVATYTPGVTG